MLAMFSPVVPPIATFLSPSVPAFATIVDLILSPLPPGIDAIGAAIHQHDE